MDMFLLAEPSTQTNREAQRVTDEAGSDPSSRERLRAGSFLRFFFTPRFSRLACILSAICQWTPDPESTGDILISGKARAK
jgi:hypothetical protein